MKHFLKTLIKILPLILIINWDYTLPTEPNIVVAGFILRASPIPGGLYSDLILIDDPNVRIVIDGTTTSGQTRCYILVVVGSINNTPAESDPSNEVCATNSVDAPLWGPGGGRSGTPV